MLEKTLKIAISVQWYKLVQLKQTHTDTHIHTQIHTYIYICVCVCIYF